MEFLSIERENINVSRKISTIFFRDCMAPNVIYLSNQHLQSKNAQYECFSLEMMSTQMTTGSGINEFKICLICECEASLKEDEICSECYDVIKQIERKDECPSRYAQLFNEFKSRLAIKTPESTTNNSSHLFQLLNVCREARMKTVDTLNDAATEIVGLSSTKSSFHVLLMMVCFAMSTTVI